jgi:hypothetical protein
MLDNPAFKSPFSNNCLGCWNLLLGIGSGIGACYLLPFLWEDVKINGLTDSICTGRFVYNDTVSHVGILFGISNFFEFVDTLFIVFRKADLEFLHYYHHVATCLYCWHSAYILTSTSVYFSDMNLFVHAIMYSYFSISAFGIRILHPFRKCITVIQIVQMGMGMCITFTWLTQCSSTSSLLYINHLCAMVMYISYGVLFLQLFVRTGRSKSLIKET